MAVYIKSALWLVGCGGLGYGLFLATSQSSDNQELVRKYNVEGQSNSKKTVMSVLDAAANTNKPLYSMTKKEIERELSKK